MTTTNFAEKYKMKEAGKIYLTKDYRLFKKIEGNRVVDENHIRKLMNSIKKGDVMPPIEVNENGQIIDGQHRYEAYKRLNKPFQFYIHERASLVNVKKQNGSRKNWAIRDHAHSNAVLNKDTVNHNKIFIDFLAKYKKDGITSNSILYILSNGKCSGKNVIDNTFKVFDLTEATKTIEEVSQINKLLDRPIDRQGLTAYMRLKNKRVLDYVRMINKLKEYHATTGKMPRIEGATTSDSAYSMQKIYNLKISKNPVDFVNVIKKK